VDQPAALSFLEKAHPEDLERALAMGLRGDAAVMRTQNSGAIASSPTLMGINDSEALEWIRTHHPNIAKELLPRERLERNP
jgi:hypothetical protein